jgi:beta-lactam-binding protein with PASTA domain
MVLIITFSFVSVLWLFLFVPPLISIPSAIGEAVGEDVAKTDKKDFVKGCEHSATKCYQAIKNGNEIARGYVIAQSPSRVALYYMGRTMQFSVGDIMLQTLETAAAQTSPKQ